jgi:aspartate/methionine/tyrosine aminotransferase
VDAWVLADEVYRGAEREQELETPSFYGKYEKVIAVGSMSKAYGLPGLRIGWIVAPKDLIEKIWARHEYVNISATVLANKLAAIALSPEVRPRLIARTRKYIRDGYSTLHEWLNQYPGMFTFTPPQAAAIAFIKYNLQMNSSLFVDRLRETKGTLIVPGDHFGMDHFFRISFGLPKDYLAVALARIHELATEVAATVQ